MIEFDQIRAYAQGLIEEADHMIDEVGRAGAAQEISKADVGRMLLAALNGTTVAEIATIGDDRSQSELPTTDPSRIPQRIRDGLDRYAQHGLPTGDCLRAVLEDRLFRAFDFADAETAAAMPAILAYITSQLPIDCWGSPEVVAAWIRKVRA